MDAKPNIMPTMAMKLAPQYGSRGTCSSQFVASYAMPFNAYTKTNSDLEFELEQDETTGMRNKAGVTENTQNAGLHAMDRLVQDLLASQKGLEDEKRKAEQKDAEIARLKGEMGQLQQRECVEDAEQVKELRRLLAFHIKNEEQLARRFRDLQAVNKDLEAQLQAAETALEERNRLFSSLEVARAPEE
ncbi:hypothetical protein A9Z42_0067430 [Trichoderma parareesei]|uniref:Uncharacterized protein n=1 Tax=Trichoderma parareesei TaxID=858221 RepID=A0A2H2ZVK3_TRIPA|nr:hypothetical protein A9Z42_0067430 [Trichoderma parareesei]